MKTHLYISIFLCFLAFIILGNDTKKNEFISARNHHIDYKKSTYNFYIGQYIDSIEKIIYLNHDYFADDYVINDNGITHYLSIGEDLIYINGDCLPVLYFTTNKRILTEFTCSIEFNPNSFQTDSIHKCLSDIKPLFTILNSTENRRTLAKTLKLNIDTKEFKESFYLDTTRSKITARFVYKKEIK